MLAILSEKLKVHEFRFSLQINTVHVIAQGQKKGK